MQDNSDSEGPEAQAPLALVDEIAGRLRPVCAHLPPDEFTALVAEIARTKIRFARREASLPGLSGLWDPPLAEALEGLGRLAPPDPQSGPAGGG